MGLTSPLTFHKKSLRSSHFAVPEAFDTAPLGLLFEFNLWREVRCARSQRGCEGRDSDFTDEIVHVFMDNSRVYLYFNDF